ncbi:hypothetical protein [Novosphingobium terrae]|uniref:hypothetical protein n=1 Tax=Novosphingobium terrae TaxID=2726189 RepID=UPI00197EC129|nr:hypothetical protein [Novosphingobium terrae]
MLLIDFVAFFCLVTLLFARETPLGQWLHKVLVQDIADRLGSIRSGHWLCAGAVLLVIGLLYWLAKADGLMFVAMSAPDFAVWFSTFEISTYADALIAVAMASSSLRIKAMRLHRGGRLTRIASKLRRQRKHGIRTTRAANDDEEEDSLAQVESRGAPFRCQYPIVGRRYGSARG